MDYLIRELSTPRSVFYVNHIPTMIIKGEEIQDLSYEKIKKCLIQNLSFRKEHPGDHINAWDFKELQDIGQKIGFKNIIRSKPGDSISYDMQGYDMDKTHPQMTLYVEMVK